MSRGTVDKKEDEKIGISEPISLKIPSRAEYVLLARLVVSQVGELAGFGQQDIYDLKLAITEAATNVIRHAEVDSFEIEYRALPGSIEIIVNDTGEGFEAEDFTGDPGSQGGFGLTVIRSLVDEVALETTAGGGTRLRMIRQPSVVPDNKTG
ncbi:MAG: ATP-binding protein [Rubrobacteraceae bacterium]